MQVKSLVSAFALTAALALSGSAFAQTTAGGVTISEEDLPAATQRCEELVTANTTELLTEFDDESTGSEDPNAGDTDATVSSTPDTNELQNATTTLDLDTINLDWCKEAGLGGAM